MYNYGYEKKKYLEEKEKEENLLRLLGFPEWKIRYLRELDDFDFNKNRSFHRNESPTEVKFFLNEPSEDLHMTTNAVYKRIEKFSKKCKKRG